MGNYTRDCDRVNPFEHDLFVGLDVDKSSIALTVRDRLGLGRSLKMPSEPGQLLSFMANNYGEHNAIFAYEAGPTGFGLYDAIAMAGYRCLVVSPASIPAAPNSRVKTNRLDSVKLAELLRGDQLQGIRIPSREYRDLRALVHMRYVYMQDIRAYKCRIKSEMLKEGIEFPKAPAGSQWSVGVIEKLRSLDCGVITSYKISSMLDHLEHLYRQMKTCEAALHSHLNGNENLKDCMKYLMSCPGIGFRIACYGLARMGDWREFGPGAEAGAFFGLVPRENSTGDRTERGSITKCGDPKLRSMLIQGAWAAIRIDPELKAFYDRVYASHNKAVAARVAIVAVARKLAERMHCVLKNQRCYDMRMAA